LLLKLFLFGFRDIFAIKFIIKFISNQIIFVYRHFGNFLYLYYIFFTVIHTLTLYVCSLYLSNLQAYQKLQVKSV
jgi:hypothetical protein